MWFGRSVIGLAAVMVAACGEAGTPPAASCADVVAVEAIAEGGDRFTFRVTVRSDDTGWEKYADAWQVMTADGAVLGTRELAHPHQDEQPFIRSLSGVVVPATASEVIVRARDSARGWCGVTAEVVISR